MKNDGKQAEKAFEAHWNAVGHVERFRDRKDLIGLNKGAKLADFKKPADYLVSAPGIPLHFAEVKSTTNGRLFEFSKIQPGQSAAALKEIKRGAGSYLFYIFSYPLSQWFYMTAKEYSDLLDAGRRSVAFEELNAWHK